MVQISTTSKVNATHGGIQVGVGDKAGRYHWEKHESRMTFLRGVGGEGCPGVCGGHRYWTMRLWRKGFGRKMLRRFNLLIILNTPYHRKRKWRCVLARAVVTQKNGIKPGGSIFFVLALYEEWKETKITRCDKKAEILINHWMTWMEYVRKLSTSLWALYPPFYSIYREKARPLCWLFFSSTRLWQGRGFEPRYALYIHFSVGRALFDHSDFSTYKLLISCLAGMAGANWEIIWGRKTF